MKSVQPAADETISSGPRSATLPVPLIPDHELLRRIGTGSYGEVWLARTLVGTLRAVKVVYRQTFEQEQQFDREFKGLQKFEPISRSHDGLVDILQLGRNDAGGYFYYVMELADDAAEPPSFQFSVSSVQLGESGAPPLSGLKTENLKLATYVPKTLRSEQRRLGRIPVAEGLDIALALTDALARLHAHGLVHRDLKPSNIIFVNGKPKLADIGLVADISEARSFVGTMGFIPPEGPGKAQADLYSLGKVLYEISTGKDRLVFPALPPDLREFPDANELVEFNEIILKACEDDPRHRYTSAQAMHDDLALLRAGKSIQRLRLIERRLALFNRVGLAAAALLIIAGGLYWGARAQSKAIALQLYVAEMNLAFQAWDGGNVPRARAFLEKFRTAEPAIRGFEWRLLDQLCRESDARFVLRGHTGIVWSVAFSPDGKRAVSAGANGLLKVWAADTGTLLTNLIGTNRVVHTVVFSPDGRTLASGGRDRMVILRDAATFEVRHRMRQHTDAIRTLAFSIDGRRLASGGEDQRVLIWDATDGRLLDQLAESMSVEHLALSPDGTLLAAAGADTSVHLWDLAKRERRVVTPQRSLLKAVAFSPDGQTLAAAGYDGVTELWDVIRSQSLGSIGSGAPVYTVVFSPDGQWLATAGTDATIHLWNLRSRQRARQLRGHTAGLNSLVFSRDGAWLASASDDRTARVWEVQPLTERRHTLAHAGLVNAVAFAPGGSQMATADPHDNALHLWDSASGEKLASLVGETDSVSSLAYQTNSIWCLSYSTEGTAIYAGAVDGSLRRWNVATRQATRTRQVHGFAVEAIALSPDGRLIATACRGAPVKLWDSATLEAVVTMPGDARVFRTAAFSPDGKWLAAGGRSTEVLLWNVATRTLTAKLAGHASEVRSVVFSPDSTTLAVADDGRAIRFWDVNTRQLLTRLEGHDAPIKSLSFSPDGRTLASGSEDSTVKLWNLLLRQEVATLRGHASQVKQVAFSPDGNVLASAGGDGVVRLWRATPLNPKSEVRNPR